MAVNNRKGLLVVGSVLFSFCVWLPEFVIYLSADSVGQMAIEEREMSSVLLLNSAAAASGVAIVDDDLDTSRGWAVGFSGDRLGRVLGQRLADCILTPGQDGPTEWRRLATGIVLARRLRPRVLALGILSNCKVMNPENLGRGESVWSFSSHELGGKAGSEEGETVTFAFVLAFSPLQEKPKCIEDFLFARFRDASIRLSDLSHGEYGARSGGVNRFVLSGGCREDERLFERSADGLERQ